MILLVWLAIVSSWNWLGAIGPDRTVRSRVQKPERKKKSPACWRLSEAVALSARIRLRQPEQASWKMMSVRVYDGWNHETYRRFRATQIERPRLRDTETNSFLGESRWYPGQVAAGASNQVTAVPSKDEFP
jgi:hypothetical protein